MKYTMHYNDVIMGAIASQNTSLAIAYSIVYSDADQRKHQSPASLAFVRWIPRTNGQLRGKCFHLMTSSWIHSSFPYDDENTSYKECNMLYLECNIVSLNMQCWLTSTRYAWLTWEITMKGYIHHKYAARIHLVTSTQPSCLGMD